MAVNVVIVDYGMGNVHSVYRKMSRLNANCVLSDRPEDVLKADKLILPGVGHFAMAMQHLATKGLLDSLSEAALHRKTPILGICLGMQLMAAHSEEGMAKGLGWFKHKVVRFQVSDTLRFKVPHTGWNRVITAKQSPLMQDIASDAEFYFVHSYHVADAAPADILHQTDYSYNFVSAIERDNIFGVQYHPEKSHGEGEKLLRNFIAL